MGERFKVLYVDDEPELLDLGRRYLEKGGLFSVDILTSPHNAFPSLGNGQYDAIVSDYQMPDMDGIEFLQKVRSSGNTIPFILFTGRGREEVVIEAINHGADFYLQKGGAPQAQFAELAHKVRQAVLRKRAERSLQESERRYRDVVETQTEFIARFRPDGTHVFVNDAYCRHYGVKKDEIIGHRFVPPLPKEDQELVRRHFTSFTPDRRVADIEHRVIMPDGSVRWHWWNDHAIFDDHGMIIEFQSVGKDITERKRSEEEIRAAYEQLAAAQEQLKEQFHELSYSQQIIEESGKKFRTIFENSPYPISINSIPDGKFIAVNKAFLQSSGYSEAEILGKSPTELGLLSLTDYGKLALHLSVSGRIENAPFVLKGKDGARIHAQFSTIPISINNKPAILTMTAEITKLKRIEEELLNKTEDLNAANTSLKDAEEELRKKYLELQRHERALRNSEEKFRALVENSLDGILITDLSGRILFANQTAGRIVDAKDCQALIEKTSILNFIAPESQAVAIGDLRKVSRGNDAFLVRYKLVSGKQREVWVDCIAKKITFEGSDAMLVSMRDITERKRAEETMRTQYLELQYSQQLLRESEAKFRAVLDQSYEFIGLMKTDGTLIEANHSALSFIGMSAAGVLNQPFWETPWWTHSPEMQERLKDAIARAVQGETVRFEATHPGTDGHINYIDFSIKPVVDETGSVRFLIPEGRNITDWKLAEEAIRAQYKELHYNQHLLRQSEAKFRAVLNQSYGFIGLLMTDGTLVDNNRSNLPFEGISDEDIQGRPFWEAPWWKNSPGARDMLKNAVMRAASGETTRFEAVFHHADGQPGYIDLSIKPVVDETGKVVYLVPEGRDITGRRRSEEELKRSENLYRAVFENTGTATILIAPDTTILMANAGWEKLTGVPRSDQENHLSWMEFLHRDDVERMKQYHYTRRKDPALTPAVYECRLIDARGDVHTCFVHADMIPGTENRIATLVDVSPLKRGEEALEESEKKALTILDNLPDPIIVHRDGTILYINPAMADSIGWTPKEMMNRPILDYIAPEYHKTVLTAIRERQEKGRVDPYEIVLQPREGERRLMMARGSTIDFNGSTAILNVLVDMTERNQANGILREIRYY